jgi:hypothetical protein
MTKSDGKTQQSQMNLNGHRVPSKTAPASLNFDNDIDDDENHHSVLIKVCSYIFIALMLK